MHHQITVVNEDEVLAANYDGVITDEEMDALYDKGEHLRLLPDH